MRAIARAALLACIGSAGAHIAAWTKGMYCRNGLFDIDQPNTGYAAIPLWNLSYDEWFMHGACTDYPPPPGEFLEIPAGGSFTVELAENRAVTSLSYGGARVTSWGDGKHHADDYSVDKPGGFPVSSAGCLSSPNLHTKSEAGAAGTVFAIAYTSDIRAVRMEDLVVFSVAPNTPFKLVATYHVPDLPACPAGGCICAWGWVPNHCGLANVYMHPYRCTVTGARTAAAPLARARPPAWCEDDAARCVRGAKQLVIAHQREGNNVDLERVRWQRDGLYASPGYNAKMGFAPGAQHDIFVGHPANDAAAHEHAPGVCGAGASVLRGTPPRAEPCHVTALGGVEGQHPFAA